jgi:hypothetical protein
MAETLGNPDASSLAAQFAARTGKATQEVGRQGFRRLPSHSDAPASTTFRTLNGTSAPDSRTTDTAPSPLGELGKIFEPGFTSGEFAMPSGRTLACEVSDYVVSVKDVGNDDYRYVSLRGNGQYGREIFFTANRTNTTSPDKAIAGRRHHPDINPLPLMDATIKYADAEPGGPLKYVFSSWQDEFLGGPNPNYVLYHRALDKMTAENGGVATDEMRASAAKHTLEYRAVAALGGFTEVRDVHEADGIVTANILRPDEKAK